MSVGKRVRDGGKAALWRVRVSGQSRSGLTVRAYCRAEGLGEAAFYWWRRTLARRDGDSAGPSQGRGPSDAPGSPCAGALRPARGTFVELAVPAVSEGAPPVEVVLRCGRVLRVREGFSPETVSRLAALLEGEAC